MNNTTETTVVKGFIQALPKASTNESARVALITPDEREIPVLHKGAGVDLLDHISADVEITGSLEDSPHVEGGKALRVRSYLVTDGYEDPWYDDDDDD